MRSRTTTRVRYITRSRARQGQQKAAKPAAVSSVDDSAGWGVWDSPVDEPSSYRYESDGVTIKTWFWVWHADGSAKKWLTTSERRLEGPPSLSTQSFHEHVEFTVLDEPLTEPVCIERYMRRDPKHPHPRMPPAAAVAAVAARRPEPPRQQAPDAVD